MQVLNKHVTPNVFVCYLYQYSGDFTVVIAGKYMALQKINGRVEKWAPKRATPLTNSLRTNTDFDSLSKRNFQLSFAKKRCPESTSKWPNRPLIPGCPVCTAVLLSEVASIY